MTERNDFSEPADDSGAGLESARNRRFATTSWSLVSQAVGDEDSGVARLAMQELCQAYWYPLYAFVRRQGYPADQAEDLTQGFFARILAGGILEGASAERGRFRSFLLTCLKNYLANQRRDQNSVKRGGAAAILSLDFATAERRYSLEPIVSSDPLQSFQAQWAVELLQVSLEAVRTQYDAQGKRELFEQLRPFLTADPQVSTQATSLEEVAAKLNMQVGAVRVALHRLRERYGQQIRLQISKTVDSPERVDEEIRELFQVFSQNRL